MDVPISRDIETKNAILEKPLGRITSLRFHGMLSKYCLLARHKPRRHAKAICPNANERRGASKSERWLSTAFAGADDAVIATDTNGAVTSMNSVALSPTGWNHVASTETAMSGRESIQEDFLTSHEFVARTIHNLLGKDSKHSSSNQGRDV